MRLFVFFYNIFCVICLFYLCYVMFNLISLCLDKLLLNLLMEIYVFVKLILNGFFFWLESFKLLKFGDEYCYVLFGFIWIEYFVYIILY